MYDGSTPFDLQYSSNALYAPKRGQGAEDGLEQAWMVEANFEQSIRFWLQTVTEGKFI